MSSSENNTPLSAVQSTQPPVLTWLRLEGLAIVAVTAIAYYGSTGMSWWLFAALWLVPDLSMLGFLINPRIGSYCYNTVHSYLLPLMAYLAGTFWAWRTNGQYEYESRILMSVLLIWCNHIGVDRALGYGLKYPSAFGHTHLKHMVKK
jgi:Domain of unknown function (DUF4260)